jgi:hypothetical protein
MAAPDAPQSFDELKKMMQNKEWIIVINIFSYI